MAPTIVHKNGHRNRIWDEIASYFARCGQKPEDMEKYIKEQTNLVLEMMYKDAHHDPENESPEMALGSYYRRYIARYGMVYDDFIDSAHPCW